MVINDLYDTLFRKTRNGEVQKYEIASSKEAITCLTYKKVNDYCVHQNFIRMYHAVLCRRFKHFDRLPSKNC